MGDTVLENTISGPSSDGSRYYSDNRYICIYWATGQITSRLMQGFDLPEMFVYSNGWDWCASSTRPHYSDYLRIYVQNHGDGNEIHQQIVRK